MDINGLTRQGAAHHLGQNILEAFTNQILTLVFKSQVLPNSLNQELPRCNIRLTGDVSVQYVTHDAHEFGILARCREATPLVRGALSISYPSSFLDSLQNFFCQVVSRVTK